MRSSRTDYWHHNNPNFATAKRVKVVDNSRKGKRTISFETVLAMRADFKTMPVAALALKYGVGKAYVNGILTGGLRPFN